jgi:hypothetical protein
LLWAPTKRGREHRMRTTCYDPVLGYGSHRTSPSSARESRRQVRLERYLECKNRQRMVQHKKLGLGWSVAGIQHLRWSRLSEQIFRLDKWSLGHG